MTVGIIGLGIMGGAYGRNLLSANVTVFGTDPDETAREKLLSAGGEVFVKIGDWISECNLIILSLANPAVLHQVCSELSQFLKPGQVVVETGTFALADKIKARAEIESCGAILLDCPVSGTGAQAAVGDLLMMASGELSVIESIKPLLAHFTKSVLFAGDFGAGSHLKYVANHAVALHNAAAAEVLNYAVKLGLDPDLVYQMLSTGAGQSRMLDLRMPLMISGEYEPPTANLKMFEKDLSVIGADVKRVRAETPMLDVVEKLYSKALDVLPNTFDTAAVYEVYKSNSK